ncbi:MAG: DNA-directed DNA polymerase II small subunit [Candidatus Thermoplasmatota archaeon]|nr:DNA-directed DNA polymerase II small subunit [Candidatus Thermoplasmatota archaeon]
MDGLGSTGIGDMRSRITSALSDRGTLAQPDAVEEIISSKNPEEYLRRILTITEMPLFLDRNFLQKLDGMPGNGMQAQVLIPPPQIPAAPSPIVPQPQIVENLQPQIQPAPHAALARPSAPGPAVSGGIMRMSPNFSPMAREIDADIRILRDVTGNLSCTGTIQDFVNYFRDRYNRVKTLLREKPSLMGAAPIKILTKMKSADEVKLIGMVNDVRTTKNGHVMVTLEDETGSINALAPKSDPKVLSLASGLVKDEVVGVLGKFGGGGDLFIMKDVLRPDISNTRTEHRSDAPIYAAFISDVHVGSDTFLKNEWNSFINWLNGNVGSPREREVVGRIKYLIVAGDLVDGIGIYPHQEEELEIHDIYAQYEDFAKKMEDVPEHIHIILQPGNHDAVRLAEPQPAFPDEIKKLFKRGNISFVGNPCTFSIHGVEVLSYHGRSMDDLIPTLKLSWHDPVSVMKHVLQRRHLAPIYGGKNQLAPESADHMVIERVPDIFVTGHIHVSSIDSYRGTLLINASAWQSQTPFQAMMGIKPDPAKVALVDLRTLRYTVKNFGESA